MELQVIRRELIQVHWTALGTISSKPTLAVELGQGSVSLPADGHGSPDETRMSDSQSQESVPVTEVCGMDVEIQTGPNIQESSKATTRKATSQTKRSFKASSTADHVSSIDPPFA